MNKAQRKKLYKVMEAKFLAGEKEHNEVLSEMPTEQLLKEIQNELIDNIFYINTLLNNNK